jgi:HK97 gp10 family phage protein
MNDGYVEVEGLAELQTALRELPDATARNVLRRVAKQALEPIAARARTLAPVDRGNLVQSITVSNRLTRRQRSQAQTADPNDVVMYVGAGGLAQAHMMEFGTQDVAAQPYMRPAWDEGKERVLTSIKELLWAEIEKAAKRAERKAAKMAGG